MCFHFVHDILQFRSCDFLSSHVLLFQALSCVLRYVQSVSSVPALLISLYTYIFYSLLCFAFVCHMFGLPSAAYSILRCFMCSCMSYSSLCIVLLDNFSTSILGWRSGVCLLKKKAKSTDKTINVAVAVGVNE